MILTLAFNLDDQGKEVGGGVGSEGDYKRKGLWWVFYLTPTSLITFMFENYIYPRGIECFSETLIIFRNSCSFTFWKGMMFLAESSYLA